jgi:3'-phosphoadenosine 5'-phosphosulfate sulfotransferase
MPGDVRQEARSSGGYRPSRSTRAITAATEANIGHMEMRVESIGETLSLAGDESRQVL